MITVRYEPARLRPDSDVRDVVQRNEDRLSRELAALRNLVALTVRSNIREDGNCRPDTVELVDPTDGVLTRQLPKAASVGSAVLVIKNASGSTNTITAQADPDDTVDGASTKTITTAWGSMILFCDGPTNQWVSL